MPPRYFLAQAVGSPLARALYLVPLVILRTVVLWLWEQTKNAIAAAEREARLEAEDRLAQVTAKSNEDADQQRQIATRKIAAAQRETVITRAELRASKRRECAAIAEENFRRGQCSRTIDELAAARQREADGEAKRLGLQVDLAEWNEKERQTTEKLAQAQDENSRLLTKLRDAEEKMDELEKEAAAERERARTLQEEITRMSPAAAETEEKRLTSQRRNSDQYRNTTDENLCGAAALNGDLVMLEWARENGCYWDGSTCDSAACHGHLEVLKWARENGCPWGSFTCRNAALNGHLEVLKWAKENGVPASSYIHYGGRALFHGHDSVFQWLKNQRRQHRGSY